MRTTSKQIGKFGLMIVAALVLSARADSRLVAWWKMDESAGATSIEDASGNGRNLALGAGCSLEAGKIGNALRFGGTLDAWGKFSYPNLTNFTFAAWFRQDGPGEVEDNVGPRFIVMGSVFYHVNPTNPVSGTGFTFWSNSKAWTSSTFAPLRVFPGKWAHVAVVYQVSYTNGVESMMWPTFYIDGVRCRTASLKQDWVSHIAASVNGMIGNNAVNGTRPLDGLLDDARLYSEALSDEEVLALYRGSLPSVDAGAGQVCHRETFELQGRFFSEDTFIRRFTGQSLWSVVSAPDGAPPLIQNTDAPVSLVSLPEAGAYTFRLTGDNWLGTVTDEVTVTRVVGDASGNAAPAVAMSVASTNCTLPMGVPVAAGVTDDGQPGPTRVRWSRVSGPGGVFFDNPFTNSTLASFSASGTYVLQLTADDGAATGHAQMTVEVSDSTADLAAGLLNWWAFDDDPDLRVANDSAGTKNLSVFENEALLQPAKTGLGLRCPHPNAAARADASTTLDNADCMSISLWLHYDNAYTNNPYMRLLDSWPFFFYYSLGTRRLYIECKGNDGAQYGWTQSGVQMTSNNWHHIAVLFDRRAAATTGMKQTFYIDGMLQGSSARADVFPGATNFTGTLRVGGNAGIRNFDGVLDDVRVYERFLTEEEVKALAVDPDNNRPPVIELVGTAVSSYVGREVDLSAAVFDDGQPVGGSLEIGWEIVSGDSAGVSFDDITAASPSVSLLKSGEYVLRLTAFDGEKFIASEHVTLKASPGGTMIRVR